MEKNKAKRPTPSKHVGPPKPPSKQLIFVKSDTLEHGKPRKESAEYPLLRSTTGNNFLLLTAVMKHDIQGIQEAMKHKADINATNIELQTSLHYAVDTGSILLTKEILSYSGVRINSRNQYGLTPLWIASWHNNDQIVQILLERGADPNEICTFKTTPLHAAVSGQSYSVIKLLIQNGAKINEKDCYGETPLHKAIDLYDTEIIKLLLLNGATFTRKDFPHLAELVLSHRYQVIAQIIKLLLICEININMTGVIDKKTVLHVAAMRGDVNIILMLIELGVDMFSKNTDNMDPLTVALTFRNYMAAQALKQEIENSQFKSNIHMNASSFKEVKPIRISDKKQMRFGKRQSFA